MLIIQILSTLIIIDVLKILFGDWGKLIIPKLIKEYFKQKNRLTKN